MNRHFLPCVGVICGTCLIISGQTIFGVGMILFSYFAYDSEENK